MGPTRACSISVFVRSARVATAVDNATIACRFLDYPILSVPLPASCGRLQSPDTSLTVQKGVSATLHPADSLAQLRLLLAEVRLGPL